MTVVADVAATALSRHPRMSEEEACSVQLVLTFLRNLLYVPELQVGGCAAFWLGPLFSRRKGRPYVVEVMKLLGLYSLGHLVQAWPVEGFGGVGADAGF